MKRGLTLTILLTLMTFGFGDVANSDTRPTIQLVEPADGSIVDPESAFTITFKVFGPRVADSIKTKKPCEDAMQGENFYIGAVDALGNTKWLWIAIGVPLYPSHFEATQIDGETISCSYKTKSVYAVNQGITYYNTSWSDGSNLDASTRDALVSKYGGTRWALKGSNFGPVTKVSIGWQGPEDSTFKIASFKANPAPTPTPTASPGLQLTFSTETIVKPPANIKWGKSFTVKIATTGKGGGICEMYYQNPGWPSRKGVVPFRLQAGNTTSVTVKPWIRVFASYSLKYACIPDGWPRMNSDNSISLYDKRVTANMGTVTLVP